MVCFAQRIWGVEDKVKLELCICHGYITQNCENTGVERSVVKYKAVESFSSHVF